MNDQPPNLDPADNDSVDVDESEELGDSAAAASDTMQASTDADASADADDSDTTDDGITADDLLTRDLPCIRCSYNLRGLDPSGNCPECGTRVRRTLNFAMERVLCMACMRPMHPSAALCPHCRTPANSAGANASYYKLAPRGVRADSDNPDEPRKPKPQRPIPPSIFGPILGVAVSTPFAILFASFAFNAGASGTGQSDAAFPMLVISFIFILLAFFSVVRYTFQQRKFRDAQAARRRELLAKAAASATPPPAPNHSINNDPMIH